MRGSVRILLCDDDAAEKVADLAIYHLTHCMILWRQMPFHSSWQSFWLSGSSLCPGDTRVAVRAVPDNFIWCHATFTGLGSGHLLSNWTAREQSWQRHIQISDDKCKNEKISHCFPLGNGRGKPLGIPSHTPTPTPQLPLPLPKGKSTLGVPRV